MSAGREAREAAATIRRLLDKVKSGDLDAPPGLMRSLRGSLAALDAMTGRRQR